MAEVKQGAIKQFQVEGLRGTFLDTLFDDDCNTVGHVPASTEQALREHFGDAVKEVKAPTPKGKAGAGSKKPEGEGEGEGQTDPQ